MKAFLVAALAGAAILLVGSHLAPPPTAQSPPAFDSAWSRDALWDDGQAEVALYAAKRPQYGKLESYEAVFIVVKEDFDAKRLVKADPPYEGRELIPVLKLNAVHSYWTPNYPYHYLASVFVRRDNPAALVKLSVGSQEWCGNTFKLVKTTPRPELTVHSYFHPEGDSTRPLDLRAGDLLEDQLPLALRSLAFAPGLELRRRVLPSLISNKLGHEPQFLDATITVVGEETLVTPAGRLAAWKVAVKFGEIRQTWWFEKAAPHTLLQMESSDGRAWILKARTRKPYWQAATYRPEM
jgi:hypothetical protein